MVGDITEYDIWIHDNNFIITFDIGKLCFALHNYFSFSVKSGLLPIIWLRAAYQKMLETETLGKLKQMLELHLWSGS